MSTWQPYVNTIEKHSVVGDLRVYKNLYSPQLKNDRDILVWLPASYAEGTKHYRVMYMHDGQNLFDAHTSFVGEWQVDETMQALAPEGIEAIIVGIPNNKQRMHEYNPYNRGDAYIRFIVETIKPLIDRDFRTLPDAYSTGIAGSSLGGLISLYALLAYPQVFGMCGAFSPAFWFSKSAMLNTISTLRHPYGKVYVDIGGKEGHIFVGAPDKWEAFPNADKASAAYLEGVRRLRDELVKVGYQEGDNLHYVEDAEARHHEADWAKRLPDALRYLLALEYI